MFDPETQERITVRKETQCVHSGTIKDEKMGGINTPIFTSSAFGYLERDDISYPRYFNTPNQKAVVDKLCALEGAEGGVLFSSGMAAISTTILAFAGAGDHVVMMDELYGGTHAFATDEFQRLGIDYTFTATDAESVCSAVKENTKVVVIESPTGDEPIVKSSVDKFFNTELEGILRNKGIETVVIAGTTAEGAVIHTATGAAMRGLKVIVPVDGMSAGTLYAEQYTAWHLINAPGSRRRTTLTRFDMIEF